MKDKGCLGAYPSKVRLLCFSCRPTFETPREEMAYSLKNKVRIFREGGVNGLSKTYYRAIRLPERISVLIVSSVVSPHQRQSF